MASYAKQMMQIAERWLEANPDPSAVMLQIPGKTKQREPDQFTRELQARWGDSWRQLASSKDLLRLEQEAFQTSEDLRVKEAELEALINRGIMPSQTKHGADHMMHTDLGRWMLSWARHGHNVIDMSPDFVASMLLTDARAIDISEVKMPFAGVLMTIPDGFAKGADGPSYTKIHLTELPRSAVDRIEMSDQVADLCASMPPSRVLDVLDRCDATFAAAGDAQCLQIHVSNGVTVLDTLVERDGLSWDGIDKLPDNIGDDADREAARTARQIAFCALAYIGSVSGSLERREVTRRKARSSDDAKRPTTWDVGRTIKISPELVRLARSGSREVAFRIKHRHIVRGHYRDQPIGHKRSERKRIWIAPFWKGPEEGAKLVHTYRLDERAP